MRWRSLPSIGVKGDGGGEVWISSDGGLLVVLVDVAAAIATLDFVVLPLSVDDDGFLMLVLVFNSSIEASTPAGHFPLIQPE